MGNEEYVYVHIGALDGRVRILTQNDEPVLDFLSDDRIANKLACKMNIGILRRPDGIPRNP